MFLTESQKHYYTAMKKLGRKKPQKVIKRPMNQFLAMFYDLSNSRRFEIAIFVLIFLNMLTMGIEHYGQPNAVFFVLEVSNAFFTTVFGLGKLTAHLLMNHNFSNCVFLCFRSDSENYRTPLSLFHGPVECVWFFVSFSFHPWYFDGRYYDWFSSFPNSSASSESI